MKKHFLRRGAVSRLCKEVGKSIFKVSSKDESGIDKKTLYKADLGEGIPEETAIKLYKYFHLNDDVIQEINLSKVELIYFHTYETAESKNVNKIFSGKNVNPSPIRSLNALIEDTSKIRSRFYSKGSIDYIKPEVRFAFSASSIDSINKVKEYIKNFSFLIKDLVNDRSKNISGYGIGLSDIDQLFKSVEKQKELETVYNKIIDNDIYIYSFIFSDWIMGSGEVNTEPFQHDLAACHPKTQSTSYVEKDVLGILFGAKEVDYTFNIPNRDELIPSYGECLLENMENYPYVFINAKQAKQFWEEEKELEAVDEHINSLSDERRGK